MGARFARGSGFALVLSAVLVALRAAAAGVEVRCARLTRGQIEELDARARLALAARPRPDLFPLSVVCDASRAWLETPARPAPVPIDEQEGLLEGTLAALESLIQPNSPPAPASPPPSAAPPSAPLPAPVPVPMAASPTATPTPTPPSDSTPAPQAPRATGGIGLSIASEPWPRAGHHSLGPRLEVALPLRGPFTVVASESVRFGLAPDGGPSTSLVDLQAGAAWGAPYAPRHTFGLVLLIGLERFAASPSDEKLRGADTWTATASVGPRVAVRAGPIELWLAIEAMARASRASTPYPVEAEIPRVGAVLSLGFFYPAESVVRARAD